MRSRLIIDILEMPIELPASYLPLLTNLRCIPIIGPARRESKGFITSKNRFAKVPPAVRNMKRKELNLFTNELRLLYSLPEPEISEKEPFELSGRNEVEKSTRSLRMLQVMKNKNASIEKARSSKRKSEEDEISKSCKRLKEKEIHEQILKIVEVRGTKRSSERNDVLPNKKVKQYEDNEGVATLVDTKDAISHGATSIAKGSASDDVDIKGIGERQDCYDVETAKSLKRKLPLLERPMTPYK